MLNHRYSKPSFFLLCLLPFLWIVGNAFWGDLGANPVETITHQTGEWTLRILILTLSISPLRQLLGLPALVRYRRMAGLFVYFYASCHFLIWFVADHSLNLASMIEDVIERPYITLGFLAFLLLTPLALTSNKWSIKKLGKTWKTLHKLVYVIIGLGVFHYLWLVKADYLEPLIYLFIAAFVLVLRLPVVNLSGNSSTSAKSV